MKLQSIVFIVFGVVSVSVNADSLSDVLTNAESYSPVTIIQNSDGSVDNVKCYINQTCTNQYTKTFYRQNPGLRLWISNGRPNQFSSQLIDILKNSYYEGLDYKRYQIDKLELLAHQLESMDSHAFVNNSTALGFELSLTDAYLNYSNDIQNGVINPSRIYPNWQVEKTSGANTYALFVNATKNNQLINNLQYLANNHPKPYLDLRRKLASYIDSYQNANLNTVFVDTPLKLGMNNKSIADIKLKLSHNYQYDITKDSNQTLFNKQLMNAIKKIQKDNYLPVTGVIDNATLQIINRPNSLLIKKIAVNLDRMRWLPDSIATRRIWVNIPSYQLQLYDNNDLVKSMPVIVGSGGKENKTCFTISKIKTIELNPYWGVPSRIATKEYLHKIQESSGYLARHDMKLYQSGTNTEVDPTTIDWSSVNQKNFNYYIKQQPGAKNALGQYKFMFNNNCGIYLHDTSNRGLFGRGDRSLSHGCVRVGDPKFLAKYLIDSNTNGLDFTKTQTYLKNQDHKYISLSIPIDVYVVYYTTYVDSTNDKLVVLKDIYDLDNIKFNFTIPIKSTTTINSNESELN